MSDRRLLIALKRYIRQIPQWTLLRGSAVIPRQRLVVPYMRRVPRTQVFPVWLSSLFLAVMLQLLSRNNALAVCFPEYHRSNSKTCKVKCNEECDTQTKRHKENYTNPVPCPLCRGILHPLCGANCLKPRVLKGKIVQKMKRCAGCYSHRYCSKRCQNQDWRKGHRDNCIRADLSI